MTQTNRRQWMWQAAAPALLGAQRKPNSLWLIAENMGPALGC